MELVDASPPPAQPIAREMTRAERWWSAFRYRFMRLRRKLPYLVWWDDEVDVTVTFSQDKLDDGMDPDGAFRRFFSGGLHEIERCLGSMGIGFDKGIGFDGRDWEWDFSLSGPISVRFRRRAMRPERRKERPRPKLVCTK